MIKEGMEKEGFGDAKAEGGEERDFLFM